MDPTRTLPAWTYRSPKFFAAEQRAAAGIPDGFFRLSHGLEDAEDLIADLAKGLAAV